MKRWIKLIAALALVFSTSCNGNVFSGISSSQTTYNSILEEMQIDVDNSNWSAAILNYNAMSSTQQQTSSALFLYASATAGACGFLFLPFLQALQNGYSTIGAGAGNTPLSLWLMQAYQNTTVTMQMSSTAPISATTSSDTYCSAADAAIYQLQQNVGSANLTQDQQIFIAVYSMAKIGMILKYWLDRTGTGSPATTVNICRNNGTELYATGGSNYEDGPGGTTDDTTGIPDFYINQIVTGLAFLNTYVSAIPNIGTGATLVTNACAALTLDGYTICSDTNATTVPAKDNQGMRNFIVQSDATGLGVYSSASAAPTAGSDPTKTGAFPNVVSGAGYWACTTATLTGCCP